MQQFITVHKKQQQQQIWVITNNLFISFFVLIIFTNRKFRSVFYGNKRKTHVRSAVPSRSPMAVK